MAQVAQASRRGDGAAASSSTPGQPELSATVAPITEAEKDKVLPLPGWLVKLYFVFPVVLYVPDIIFNYVVYSRGVQPTNNTVLYVASVVLWSFLSVGVVGMAYLLSVLAPWHWGQGHRMQAFFCGLGVVIATVITTWNSLAFRSQDFVKFPTDDWVYSLWPQLKSDGVSITMILVAIAPPFWGLFWAIVQPTETGRSLRQLQESHEERMMRMQQEAELKRLKAETNAKVREAQLRGMAATAAAARQQAGALFNQKRDGENAEGEDQQAQDAAAGEGDAVEVSGGQATDAPNVLQLPTLSPTNTRELAGSRGDASFYNHASAATPGAHSAPAAGLHPVAQPALMAEADVRGFGGLPGRPPTLGGLMHADVAELDGMTGTTGPRPSVRRTNELGSLARGMTGPSPRIMSMVEEAYQQLSASSTNKRVADRDLVALSAEKLGVDESTARSAVRTWREAKRAPRA